MKAIFHLQDFLCEIAHFYAICVDECCDLCEAVTKSVVEIAVFILRLLLDE